MIRTPGTTPMNIITPMNMGAPCMVAAPMALPAMTPAIDAVVMQETPAQSLATIVGGGERVVVSRYSGVKSAFGALLLAAGFFFSLGSSASVKTSKTSGSSAPVESRGRTSIWSSCTDDVCEPRKITSEMTCSDVPLEKTAKWAEFLRGCTDEPRFGANERSGCGNNRHNWNVLAECTQTPPSSSAGTTSDE